LSVVSRSFVLRAAEESDLPAINALMHASSAYKGAYYTIIENYFVTALDLARNEVFVADADGTLIGFYSLIVDGKADLDLMFVSDAAQGLGVGRALFDHMKLAARRRGHDAVLIGSHPPSVGFYERMGAVRRGLAPPLERVTWERPLLELALTEN
jgi:GNAT superfamily N-acetyltransferase